MNIKNEEAESLARALAARTGETLTRAVTIALGERLGRMQSQPVADVAERAGRLREIAQDAAKRWTEPYRSADHGALLYDERGLPR